MSEGTLDGSNPCQAASEQTVLDTADGPCLKRNSIKLRVAPVPGNGLGPPVTRRLRLIRVLDRSNRGIGKKRFLVKWWLSGTRR